MLVEGKGFVWRNVRSYGNFVGASLQIEADLGKPRPPAPQVLKTARWADARLPLEAHRLSTVIPPTVRRVDSITATTTIAFLSLASVPVWVALFPLRLAQASIGAIVLQAAYMGLLVGVLAAAANCPIPASRALETAPWADAGFESAPVINSILTDVPGWTPTDRTLPVSTR